MFIELTAPEASTITIITELSVAKNLQAARISASHLRGVASRIANTIVDLAEGIEPNQNLSPNNRSHLRLIADSYLNWGKDQASRRNCGW